MCDSITERFFCAPDPRTKYFERIFCRSISYIYKYDILLFTLFKKTKTFKKSLKKIPIIGANTAPIPKAKWKDWRYGRESFSPHKFKYIDCDPGNFVY